MLMVIVYDFIFGVWLGVMRGRGSREELFLGGFVI